MLRRGEVDDAVDAPPQAAHAAVLRVAAEELTVKASLLGLLGREEASLPFGSPEELVPARRSARRWHRSNVNVTLSFVQLAADRPAQATGMAGGSYRT
jgi:hypothetical protein